MRRRTLCFSIVVILVGLAHAGFAGSSPDLESPALAEGAPQPASSATAVPLDACQTRIAQLPQDHLHVLITTLPDPVASEFGREFDMFLAGIRRAFEVGGFHQTLHCLPWTEAFDADGSLSQTEGFDYDRYGTVIFEGGNASWMLYIVGETPAQGINRTAMLGALDSARRLGKVSGGPDSPIEIKILGPTFSGSVESIGKTLLEWWPEPLEAEPTSGHSVAVLSGTATRSSNRRLIKAAADGLPLGFASMATSTALLNKAMWDRVVPERLGVDKGDQAVAILQEASPYAEEFSERGFKVFQFPMNVARSIEEYEKHRSDEQAVDGGLAVDLPTSTLPLRLGRRRLIPDNIPSYDVGTTSTVDLLLSNIARRIAQSQIEVVAIAATSTTDKIFLAHYIRHRAPNVRLVTFEADLLLAHPEIAESTRGMLVVSSHPMVDPAPETEPGSDNSEAQPTSGTEPAASDSGDEGREGQFIHHFGSDGHQGVFRAATALLSADDFDECLVTGPQEVWVGVVGNGAIVPLERIPASELVDPTAPADPCLGKRADLGTDPETKPGTDPGTYPGAGSEPGEATTSGDEAGSVRSSTGWKPPRGWFLVFSFLSFAVLALLYLTIRRIARGGTTTGIGIRDISSRKSYPMQTRRLAFVAILLVSVTAGYPMAIVPYIHYEGTHFWTTSAAVVGLLFTGTLFLISLYLLAALTLRTVRDWQASNSEQEGRFLLLAPLAAAIAACILPVVVLGKAIGSDMAPLLMDRCVRIGSGVNPLLPAMLAAALIIGWLSLCLLRFDAVYRIPGGDDTKLPPPRRSKRRHKDPQSIAEHIEAIRLAILPGGFGVRRWSIDVGLFAACFAMPVLYLAVYNGISLRLVRGIEGEGFDKIMTILFVAGLCMAITSGITARRVWNSLRDFLDLLDEACDVGADGEAAKSAPEGWFRKERHRLRRRSRVIAARNGAWRALTGEERLGPAATNAERAARERRCTGRWLELAGDLEADTRGLSLETWAERQDAWHFFLWQCAVVVGAVLRQLLNLVGFFTLGLLTLMAVVTIYAFEPRSVLTLTVGLLMALGAIFSVVMILQMEKNETLSRMSGFQASFKWNRQVLGRIGLFAGVPLFGLLTTRFPVVGDVVVSWLKPILKALI